MNEGFKLNGNKTWLFLALMAALTFAGDQGWMEPATVEATMDYAEIGFVGSLIHKIEKLIRAWLAK